MTISDYLHLTDTTPFHPPYRRPNKLNLHHLKLQGLGIILNIPHIIRPSILDDLKGSLFHDSVPLLGPADLGESSPAVKVGGVAFVAMGFFGFFP